jgi:hypothetical protein
MRYSTRIALLFCASLVSLMGTSVQACGDKVAALGSGVPFERVMARRATGRVVMYMNGVADRNAVDEARGRLVRALERAGHHVSVAHTEAELMDALRSSPVDVVLADMNASASPAQTALASTCVIHPADRKTSSLVHAVDDIVARRTASGDYPCAASGRPGI